MVDRIASYGQTNALITQAMRLQAKYASTQAQSVSGLKSENFDGIAKDTQRLLNLESQFSTITAQIETMSAAQNRLTAMQSATDSISSLLTQVMSALTQAMSGGASMDTTTVTTAQAQGWLDSLVSTLNSKYGSSYLFSGSARDVAPVDLTDADYDATQTATANTDYYQGDGTLDTVRASGHLKLTYGVTADNTAFEQAIRALQLIAANPDDQTALTEAHTLLGNASDAVADISGVLASKASILSAESETQTAMLDYLDTNISDLRSVDMAQATIELTQIETQLETSFSTLSTLLKLKLTDYL